MIYDFGSCSSQLPLQLIFLQFVSIQGFQHLFLQADYVNFIQNLQHKVSITRFN